MSGDDADQRLGAAVRSRLPCPCSRCCRQAALSDAGACPRRETSRQHYPARACGRPVVRVMLHRMTTPWPVASAVAQSHPLQEAGPAQSEWLVHFCARPSYLPPTQGVPQNIVEMNAYQRLFYIIQERRLRGFRPFGSQHPMICLSESPLPHLSWLILQKGFQSWGLFLNRQWVYDNGGAPAWYVRADQYAQLSDDQRRWAVRLDATNGSRSDWLHEREWRIPLPDNAELGLALTQGAVAAILVPNPAWQDMLAPGSMGSPIMQRFPARYQGFEGLPHWWWNHEARTWQGV